MSGDIQSARLVSVEEPRGIFSPSSEVIPFPAAWGYRLGKRFNLPLLRSLNPTELMAAELRREGMSVSVGRPSAAAEPAQAP
jgi:hypothetical protein